VSRFDNSSLSTHPQSKINGNKMGTTTHNIHTIILNMVELADVAIGTGQESDGIVSPTVQQTRSYKYTGIYRGAI